MSTNKIKKTRGDKNVINGAIKTMKSSIKKIKGKNTLQKII